MKKWMLTMSVPVLLASLAGCGTTDHTQKQSIKSPGTMSINQAETPVKVVFSPVQEGICTAGTQFHRDESVILRLEILDAQSGKALTNRDLSDVDIVIPSDEVLQAEYGSHQGTIGSTNQFWTAPWRVPGDYPTGAVNCKVEITGRGGMEKLKTATIRVQTGQLVVVS